jgi:membrane associated rhomboid family serine protease
MLFALLLGYLNLLPGMANTAHLTGLIWGCFIAIPSAILSRFFDSKMNSK